MLQGLGKYCLIGHCQAIHGADGRAMTLLRRRDARGALWVASLS